MSTVIAWCALACGYWAAFGAFMPVLTTGDDATLRHAFGRSAVSCGFLTVAMIVSGHRTGASLMAGLSAAFTWLWWTSGGGDGLRKRMKALRQWLVSARKPSPATV